MGQGTASEHLEGQVVLRRTSRKIKEVIDLYNGLLMTGF